MVGKVGEAAGRGGGGQDQRRPPPPDPPGERGPPGAAEVNQPIRISQDAQPKHFQY